MFEHVTPVEFFDRHKWAAVNNLQPIGGQFFIKFIPVISLYLPHPDGALMFLHHGRQTFQNVIVARNEQRLPSFELRNQIVECFTSRCSGRRFFFIVRIGVTPVLVLAHTYRTEFLRHGIFTWLIFNEFYNDIAEFVKLAEVTQVG